ncbi:hypothetical protein D3C81_1452340 [compost metagenome]
MAIDILRQRVDDQVDPVLTGTEKRRWSESSIDGNQCPVCMGNFSQRSDICNLSGWISNRLGMDQFGIRADRLANSL